MLVLGFVAALGSTAVVRQQEYLTRVESQVYQAEGAPDDLARRARACMASILQAADDAGQVIVSEDTTSGVVVGSNALDYRDRFVPWRIRSRLTFEGREHRFRLTHTSIERHNDAALGTAFGGSPWQGIGKWRGSGWQRAEQALVEVSSRVADCVVANPAAEASGDW